MFQRRDEKVVIKVRVRRPGKSQFKQRKVKEEFFKGEGLEKKRRVTGGASKGKQGIKPRTQS